MELLRLDRVSVAYGPVRAIRDVSLVIERGEIVTVLGANGAGKTTLLNGIMGLIPIQSGSIELFGKRLRRLPPERLVRQGMTLTPEGRHVFAGITVDGNLRLGSIGAQGRTKTEWVHRRREILTLFPVLEERSSQLAGTLSGGEQQQLAIARSLMSEPELLLLDEPSLGLAPQLVSRMFELIAALRARGTTILLVEQNTERALELADRGYVLSSGEVMLAGSAADLLSAPEVRDAYLGAALA
jgi:branched-chain amino acid transport system ATP-binding protein